MPTNQDKRNITDEQLILILKDKVTALSARKCGQNYLGCKSGTPISNSIVDAVWNGTRKPIDPSLMDSEYHKLVAFVRNKNNVNPCSNNVKDSSRNFTDEQLMSILKDKKSSTSRAKVIGEKYIGFNSCLNFLYDIIKSFKFYLFMLI